MDRDHIMDEQSIPEEIVRFVLTSIPSVPHLEALLLLRNEAQQEWNAQMVARWLYTNQATANEVLSDLSEAGFLTARKESNHLYRYFPQSPEQGQMVDRLAEVYKKNLIAVTELIHAKGKVKAQQFADAFILRKE